MGIVNAVSLWETASGTGKTCESLLNFTWWKRIGYGFIFLYLYHLSAANQPHSKVCMHSYLFPFPVSHQTHNATEYESAISKPLFTEGSSACSFVSCDSIRQHFYHPVYRSFWSIFMLIGVATVVLAGFIIICAAPFTSPRLYKTGGGLFLVSGRT